MASRKVVVLLLLATAGQGQESGGKSRFDQILSDFGFTGIAANPRKGVETPRNQPPSRPGVSNHKISGGKISALSNLQAIASGQRGDQGLPDGSRADTFSRSLTRSQGPRPQSSRPQPPRREPPRPQIAEDIRSNSIPHGPVRTGASPDNALAALFKVAKSGGKSGGQTAPQVLNDRAAIPVIPKGRTAGASNKQIISSERSLRGRGGGRRTESKGRGASASVTNKPSRGSVGRKNDALQAAARTGLRSSAQAETGQLSSAGNAAPALSNPSFEIRPTKDSSAQLQFDQTLAQFGFQPRLLSGHQSKNPSVQKKPATPPKRVQTTQPRPAQALVRPEGRRPFSQQARPPPPQQAQAGKSSALGNLQAIATGNNPGNLVVKNRGRTGASPDVSAPVTKTQRPSRPVSFSSPRGPPPPRPTPTRHPIPTPQPTPTPHLTPRTAPAPVIPQRPTPKAPQGSTFASAPSNSALGNLQAIAAGEKPTLVVRNRSRGQIPGRPSSAKPASNPTITPAFQQAQTSTKPVVNPFVNLELVTFPAVPRRGEITEAAEAVTSPPRAISPSRVRENEAVEVPRSSLSKETRNEVSRPSSIAADAESLSNSKDKRTRLPTRFEEENKVEERKSKPAKKHHKKKGKKGGKPKRPSKKKQNRAEEESLNLGLGSLGGPVAAGCVQICGSLIYEVYMLLGGHICDCSVPEL